MRVTLGGVVGLLGEVKRSVGTRPSKICAVGGTCPCRSSRRRTGDGPDQWRTVRLGSSSRAVRAPTRILATSARRLWTARVLRSSERRTGGRSAWSLCASMKPSALSAHLRITYGRCSVWAVRKNRFMWRASASSTPTTTSTPDSRNKPIPRPATFGKGSTQATTTRGMPERRIKSAQGGVLPWCEQGSRVT